MLRWSVKCFCLEIGVVWESRSDGWVLTGTVAVSSSVSCTLWVQSCTRFSTALAASADQRAPEWCDHAGVCCWQLWPVHSADAATCRCSRTWYHTATTALATVFAASSGNSFRMWQKALMWKWATLQMLSTCWLKDSVLSMTTRRLFTLSDVFMSTVPVSIVPMWSSTRCLPLVPTTTAYVFSGFRHSPFWSSQWWSAFMHSVSVDRLPFLSFKNSYVSSGQYQKSWSHCRQTTYTA